MARDYEGCRETPPCGAAVIDRRQHRRWHEAVVTCDFDPPRAPDVPRRFVGVDEPVPLDEG